MQMLSFAGVGVQVRLQPRRPREVPRTTKNSAMKSLYAACDRGSDFGVPS